MLACPLICSCLSFIFTCQCCHVTADKMRVPGQAAALCILGGRRALSGRRAVARRRDGGRGEASCRCGWLPRNQTVTPTRARATCLLQCTWRTRFAPCCGCLMRVEVVTCAWAARVRRMGSAVAGARGDGGDGPSGGGDRRASSAVPLRGGGVRAGGAAVPCVVGGCRRRWRSGGAAGAGRGGVLPQGRAADGGSGRAGGAGARPRGVALASRCLRASLCLAGARALACCSL